MDQVLTWLSRLSAEPIEEEVEDFILTCSLTTDEVADVSWDLWSVLAIKTSGHVQGILRNLEEFPMEVRGLHAWCRIACECRGTSSSRLLGLTDRIFRPKRASKMADVGPFMEAWLEHVREYERASGTKLQDSLLTSGLIALCPSELARDVGMIPGLETFQAARQYVQRQASMRHEPHFSGPSSGPAARLRPAVPQPTPMDTSALYDNEADDAEAFMLKGGKGGKFPGTCH